jgi:hypothetical protein
LKGKSMLPQIGKAIIGLILIIVSLGLWKIGELLEWLVGKVEHVLSLH